MKRWQLKASFHPALHHTLEIQVSIITHTWWFPSLFHQDFSALIIAAMTRGDVLIAHSRTLTQPCIKSGVSHQGERESVDPVYGWYLYVLAHWRSQKPLPSKIKKGKKDFYTQKSDMDKFVYSDNLCFDWKIEREIGSGGNFLILWVNVFYTNVLHFKWKSIRLTRVCRPTWLILFIYESTKRGFDIWQFQLAWKVWRISYNEKAIFVFNAHSYSCVCI